MSILISRPHLQLQPFILRYVCQKLDVQSRQSQFPAGSLRLPDTAIRIAFHFSGAVPWMEIGNSRYEQPKQNIRGYQLHPLHFNSHHAIDVFTIEFSPYGFFHFFGLPCSSLQETPLELGSVLNEEYAYLSDILSAGPDFSQRVAFLDHYFARKLRDDRSVDTAHRIHQLLRTKGRLPTVRELATDTFLTERTLRRFFLCYFGMSPKLFIRLSRFEQCMERLRTHPDEKLSDLAYRMGYFDQAHFIEEVKHFSGMRPGMLKRLCQ